VGFFDSTNGLLIGYDSQERPLLRKTTDGGATWTDVSFPAHASGKEIWMLQGLAITNEQEAWIVGAAGGKTDGMGNAPVILRSVDKGSTWTHEMSESSGGQLLGVAFVASHWGWAVGSGGKIYSYTDGTDWTGSNDEDAGSSGQDSYIEPEPVGWALHLGTLDEDGNVKPYPNNNELDSDVTTFSGDGTSLGAKGECFTEETSGGCGLTTSKNPPPISGILILLASILGLAILLRASRLSKYIVVLAAIIVLPACGETTTTRPCDDVLAFSGDSDGKASGISVPVINPESWTCTLPSPEVPPHIPTTQGRVAGVDGEIVFVRADDGDINNLWLIDPETKAMNQLTFFKEPGTIVAAPSWSPSRTYISFISNYGGNTQLDPWNVFIIKVTSSECWQGSPASSSGIISAAPANSTLTGKLKLDVGGVVSSLQGQVGYPGKESLIDTAPDGSFSINVPAGEGALVLTGMVGTIPHRAIAPYNIAENENVDLGIIIGSPSPKSPTLFRPVWSSDSKTILVYKDFNGTSSFMKISTGDENWVPWLKELTTIAWLSPFGQGFDAIGGGPDHGEDLTIINMGNGKTIKEQSIWFLDMEAPVAISPSNYLAAVTETTVEVVGSDVSGALVHSTAAGQIIEDLVPGQLDWSPNGMKIVATIASQGGYDLILLDLENNEMSQLTDDHTASQPAWYGR
jgi:hypothetical protein